MTCEGISRRGLLYGGMSLAAWGALPTLPSLAASRDPRLLVVVLRGALDGLATVMPTGDPDFLRRRGAFADDIRNGGEAFRLDRFFSLSPAMPKLARLYREGDALFVHAVATPYRARSHFDGQDVLESGLPDVARADSGWLNRAISELGGRARAIAQPRGRDGLALGYRVPLIMQGKAPVLSWAPQALPDANDDTVARLLDLYDAEDPQLAEVLRKGVQLDAQLSEVLVGGGAVSGAASGDGMQMGAMKQDRQRGRQIKAARQMARAAARLLASDDGPRIAAMGLDGWDTHANEKPGTGRMARLLGGLDDAFGDLAEGLKPVWKDTVIVAVTEFGRTVDVNGTAGTDHGTGGVAFVLGGGVRGGRVVADWPGLSDTALFQNRDIMPTADLRGVLKGVLRDHLGLGRRALNETVFPQSASARAMDGLIRT